jgi:trans-2,3-dihydro-3-hydroxyanthranilate isomerase
MASYRFVTADVFTERTFGGNPLAVLPDARGLDEKQMQAVAREFNLSETVFVLPPEDHDHCRRLRIFTPGRELPFAGHPTLGAAFVLASIDEIHLAGDRTCIVFEEGAGPVPVSIASRGGSPLSTMLTAPRLPEPGPTPPDSAALAAVLSLGPEDLLSERWRPEAFSCGVPFLFLAVRDRSTLAGITVRMSEWEATLRNYWAPSMFVFCRDPGGTSSNLRARMFAPDMGIAEDPATGAAVAAFAGYLGARLDGDSGPHTWTIEQGVEMGRPSILKLEADFAAGRISEVRVGGRSVLVSEGTIEVPEI